MHISISDSFLFLIGTHRQRALAMLVTALCLASASAAAQTAKINISYPEGGAHLPLFYARDKGIFSMSGLDVSLLGLGGGPVAAAALQSGEVQIADVTGSEVVSANAAGADIIVLATLTPVYPYVFMVSPTILSKDDLRNQIVAVRAAGDATDIATRVLLRTQGLDPDSDVTILGVQQEGARMAALVVGQVCCTVAQVQDRALLERNGFHVLFDMTTLGIENAQGVIATTRTYAQSHPSVIQSFMDALIESIARLKIDRTGALPVLKAQLRLDEDAIVSATYDFFAGTVVPSVPMPKVSQFSDTIAILSRSNDKVRGFDISHFIDSSFLASSVARGLDKSR